MLRTPLMLGPIKYDSPISFYAMTEEEKKELKTIQENAPKHDLQELISQYFALDRKIEDRHFADMGGDQQAILDDACDLVPRIINDLYHTTANFLSSCNLIFKDDEIPTPEMLTHGAAISQNDGSFLFDRDKMRDILLSFLWRHLEALDDEETEIVKDHIEDELSNSAFVVGQKGGSITVKGRNIRTNKPRKYNAPHDLISQLMFIKHGLVEDNGLNRSESDIELGTKNKRELHAFVLLDYSQVMKDLNINGTPEFTLDDFFILSAICTNIEEGNNIITYDLIYRTMTGKTDKEVKCPDDMSKMITAALHKFRTFISIHFKEKLRDGTPKESIIFEGAIVPYTRLTCHIGGHEVSAIQAFTQSPLYEFARFNGYQITRQPIKILDVPGLYNNQNSRKIKQVLIYRIFNQIIPQERRKKKQYRTYHRITLTYIIKNALGINNLDELSKAERLRIRTTAEKCLDYWVKIGKLEGYKTAKDSKTRMISGYDVCPIIKTQTRPSITAGEMTTK